MGIKCRIVGQTHLIRAVRVHHINLNVAVAVGPKSNLLRVRYRRAIVAGIADTVAVRVELVGVGNKPPALKTDGFYYHF